MNIKIKVIIAANLLFCAMFAAAKSEITSVKVNNTNDVFNVFVKGSHLKTPHVRLAGHLAIVEFKAHLKTRAAKVNSRSKSADYMRYRLLRANPPKSDIIISLRPNTVVSIHKDAFSGDYQISTQIVNTMITQAKKKKTLISSSKAMPVFLESLPNLNLDPTSSPVTGSDMILPVIDPSMKLEPVNFTISDSRVVQPIVQTPPQQAAPQNYVPITAKIVPQKTVKANIKPYKAKTAKVGRSAPTAKKVESASTLFRNGLVSLDFVDAEIGNVLKALAIQSGANIVTGPDVKGTVTVSLAGVSVESALSLITKLSSLKYAKIDNTYVVGTAQTINSITAPAVVNVKVKPQTIVEVVRIQHGDLDTISRAVSEVMKDITDEELTIFANGKGKNGAAKGTGQDSSNSSGATSPDDPRSDHYLVLTGGPNIVEAAKAAAIELDKQFAEAQYSGQVIKVYHAKHTDGPHLLSVFQGSVDGSSSTSGGSSAGGSAGGSSSSSGSTGSTTGGGSPSFPLFPNVKFTLGPVPVVSSHSTNTTQVSTSGSAGGSGGSSAGGSAGGAPGVTATASTGPEPPLTLVMQGPEADVKKAMEFACAIDQPVPQVLIEARVVDVNLDDLKSLGLSYSFNSSSTVGNTPGASNTKGTFDAGGNSGITIHKLFNDLALDVTLNALFKKDTARILATPRISVLDGRYAEIFIGDEVKYIESITQSSTGQNITVGTAKAGIQLNVAPRISVENGTITMNIHPEVSVIKSYLSVPGGGTLPQFTRRFADTTVRVKDGETLVIGGLIREDDLKTVSKVPLLGDLPFLGYLFRKYSTEKVRNEVVIFITPHIQKD